MIKLIKCYLVVGYYCIDTYIVLGVFVDKGLAEKFIPIFKEKHKNLDNISLEVKLLYYV